MERPEYQASLLHVHITVVVVSAALTNGNLSHDCERHEWTCAVSEGRALRRQSLQDRMQTMTPGASKATNSACTALPRMTRAARRKLAVVG